MTAARDKVHFEADQGVADMQKFVATQQLRVSQAEEAVLSIKKETLLERIELQVSPLISCIVQHCRLRHWYTLCCLHVAALVQTEDGMHVHLSLRYLFATSGLVRQHLLRVQHTPPATGYCHYHSR